MSTTAVASLVAVAALVADLKTANQKNASTSGEIAKLEQAKSLFADMPEMISGIQAKIDKVKADSEYVDTTEIEQNIISMVKQLPDAELLALVTKGARTSTGGSGTGTKRAKLVTMLDGSTQTFANKAEIVRQYIDPNFDQNPDGTKKSISASLFLTPEKLASAGIAKIENVETEAEGDSEADSE